MVYSEQIHWLTAKTATFFEPVNVKNLKVCPICQSLSLSFLIELSSRQEKSISKNILMALTEKITGAKNVQWSFEGGIIPKKHLFAETRNWWCSLRQGFLRSKRKLWLKLVFWTKARSDFSIYLVLCRSTKQINSQVCWTTLWLLHQKLCSCVGRYHLSWIKKVGPHVGWPWGWISVRSPTSRRLSLVK